MTKRFAAALALLLCCCMLFTACCSQTVDKSTSQVQSNSSAIHFTDDDGREINLNTPCSRIISLYSAHTENLFALGAGELLIGGHTTCIYPPEAAFLDTFDYNGDPEQVIAAEPDLVLIRPFITRKVPDYVAQLESAGITVVSLYPESYDDFPDYIGKLAMLTATEQAAQKRLEEFYAAIDEITALTGSAQYKQTVFFESTETNIRTVTPDSMAGRAMAFAGGTNLASDVKPVESGSTIALFGAERVLENAELIDVYISQRGAMNAGGNLISIGERAGYDTIKAVKNGRVYLINEKLISSPTFRYQKGVGEIARYLYPELMDDLSAYENDDQATRLGYANILMKALHLQIYVPSSSKYYKTEQKGHTFGLFEDVCWSDEGFDAVESAVYAGYIRWEKTQDGLEYFYPDRSVSREELAKTIFLIGDFSPTAKAEIADIDKCEKPRIVQTLVDEGIFTLEGGRFYPERTVTNNEILSALKAVLA